MTLNLATLLEDSARRHPTRDAVVLGPTRLTYAQVDAAANQVAHVMVSRGIRPGDKVALSCPNLPFFPIVYYGLLKAGAVVVPLNVLLKSGEIAYHLRDSQARAYVCFEGTAELPMGADGHAGFQQVPGCEHFLLVTADPMAPAPIPGVTTLGEAMVGQPAAFDTVATLETDPAVILYTSGTTGQSKGAQLSHANLVLNALTANRLFGSLATGYDRHLVALPLFHSFGSTVQMNAGFAVASTLVLLPRFEPRQAAELLQRERITFFAGVPTMYWALLSTVDDSLADLRVAVSGGASLPVEIIKQFRDRFGVQILEGYGLSETSPLATFSDPEREPRAGSIGAPVWGVQLKLITDDWRTVEAAGEIGEIAIRGHNIMTGYLNRPEATAEAIRDGWFRTGDLARRDEDGFYYIVDRAKDMIIRGGFNVYPREIEEVLMTHPAVSLAAVVGVPHESHGEEVKAFIVRTPGAEITEDELIAWTRDRIAAYKYPRLVEFADSLPMTATGKILKRELVRR
jgi:long-chain acyl-CoA synthetase